MLYKDIDLIGDNAKLANIHTSKQLLTTTQSNINIVREKNYGKTQIQENH